MVLNVTWDVKLIEQGGMAVLHAITEQAQDWLEDEGVPRFGRVRFECKRDVAEGVVLKLKRDGFVVR